MKESSAERRKFVRILVRVLVDFESPDTYLYDYSSNLSEGGIFIETDKPVPVGTELTLRFTLPGLDRVFEARGVIRWLNEVGDDGNAPVPDLGQGMGIEFIEMDQTDKDIIREFIDKK